MPYKDRMSNQKMGFHRLNEKFSSPIGKELAVLADGHILVTARTSRHEDPEHQTHERKGAVLGVVKDRPQGKDLGEDLAPQEVTTSTQAVTLQRTNVMIQEFPSTQIASRMSATLATTRIRMVSVSRDTAEEIRFVLKCRAESTHW